MNRKTKWIVYVDKSIMDNANALFDAVYAHFIKKELEVTLRKRFFKQFMDAPNADYQLKVIDEWVIVRDVTTFPFRKNTDGNVEGNEVFDTPPVETKETKEIADEDKGDKESVPMDNKPVGKPEQRTAPHGRDKKNR